MMNNFYYEENEKLSDKISTILSLLKRIDKVAPDSYSLIWLTIHLSELTKKLTVQSPTYFTEMSILHVRQLTNIVSNLCEIHKSAIYVLKKNDGYYEPSLLDDWCFSRSGSNWDEDGSVVEEWEPTPLESEIMRHIDSYSSFNLKVVKDLTSTYNKVVESFMKECEVYLKGINFDNILLQMYAKYKAKHYNRYVDIIKTRVAKFCEKVRITSEDYQKYLFDYLGRLKDESEHNQAKKCIYDAHIIGQPLIITNKYIKWFLLRKDNEVTEKDFDQIAATIIGINFIKEKCGDITQDDFDEINNSEINKNASERKPAILFTEKGMKLWKKLQDEGYVDENFQPTVSKKKAAIIAHDMGLILNIKPLWEPFEQLWNLRNGSNIYCQAYNYTEYGKSFSYDIQELLGKKP